jgi:hypothetical protein
MAMKAATRSIDVPTQTMIAKGRKRRVRNTVMAKKEMASSARKARSRSQRRKHLLKTMGKEAGFRRAVRLTMGRRMNSQRACLAMSLERASGR